MTADQLCKANLGTDYVRSVWGTQGTILAYSGDFCEVFVQVGKSLVWHRADQWEAAGNVLEKRLKNLAVANT